MKAKVVKRVVLENLPSASGVEVINGIIYIIGDDAPYLYCLDHALKLIEKVELFKTDEFGTGRIPKRSKPDLECMMSFVMHNNNYLFIFGSGATENREKGYLVKLPTKFNKKHVVQEISLKPLYDLLRSHEDIAGGGSLNLEGAAASGEKLVLLNRANAQAGNTALVFSMEEFLVFVTENEEMVPFPEVIPYILPTIKGVQAGFSGADFFEEKLFFTASVEDAPDAVQDGEVLGSFIGIARMTQEKYAKERNRSISEIESCVLITENEIPYEGKVESVSVYDKEGGDTYIAVAVTDNDLGGSELLMLELTLAP